MLLMTRYLEGGKRGADNGTKNCLEEEEPAVWYREGLSEGVNSTTPYDLPRCNVRQ